MFENDSNQITLKFKYSTDEQSKSRILEYIKNYNNLRNIISNDSIVIKDYKVLNERINKDCKKAIRQRNIAIGGAVAFLITTIVLLVK